MYKAKKVNSTTFQRFHCLTLDVQGESNSGSGSGSGKKAVGRLSISTCLDTYFKEEVCMYVCYTIDNNTLSLLILNIGSGSRGE